MEKRNKTADIIVVGFALFSIFFGAGNLIFPPYLGHMAGSNWAKAMIGFLLTDPVLPILGVIATIYIGGRADDMGKRVHPTYAKIIGALAILIIGPFFAVPRTAATTYDIGIAPYFPNIPLWALSLVFFIITWILTVNESGVVDAIGKYLTPALLITLFIIIVGSIVMPVGAVAQVEDKNFFLKGFTEGYQTMDALGSPLMAGIVISDLIRKGYKKRSEQVPVAVKASFVTFILLALVYGGLTFVGSTASQVVPQGTERVPLLLEIVHRLLGNVGSVALSLAISLACLTTSVGLSATFGNFFQRIFKDKISYKVLVTVAIVVSFFVSLLGLEQIIKIAVPILTLLYPMFIVLIILSLFDKSIKYDLTYTGGVVGALCIAIPMALNDFNLIAYGNTPYKDFLEGLPFGKAGFPWMVPAIIGIVVFTVIAMMMGDKAHTRSEHQYLGDDDEVEL